MILPYIAVCISLVCSLLGLAAALATKDDAAAFAIMLYMAVIVVIASPTSEGEKQLITYARDAGSEHRVACTTLCVDHGTYDTDTGVCTCGNGAVYTIWSSHQQMRPAR